jgi:hypothetical protein
MRGVTLGEEDHDLYASNVQIEAEYDTDFFSSTNNQILDQRGSGDTHQPNSEPFLKARNCLSS